MDLKLLHLSDWQSYLTTCDCELVTSTKMYDITVGSKT